MRSAVLALLLVALSTACEGADAGYRAPSFGCDGWSFCGSIETRGRFDALHGFLGAGAVVAYRSPRSDGTAAAWLSTPGAEESLAPRVVTSATSLRRGLGTVLYAVPRFSGDYDSEPFSTRVDLHLRSAEGTSARLAEDVAQDAWALCSTGEWLWTTEGRSAASPYPNCGTAVLRHLGDGRTTSVADRCASANSGTAWFSSDCRYLVGSDLALWIDLSASASTLELPGWTLDRFSRGDRFLVFTEQEPPDPQDYAQVLRIVGIEDLREVATVDGASTFGQRTFSPDGAWFASDRDGGPVSTPVEFVHLGDGRRVALDPVGYEHSAVAFSPAGDRAAFLSWDDATDDILADLVLVDLASGEARTVDRFTSSAAPRHARGNPPMAFDATGRRLVYARGAGSLSVLNRERELIVADAATGSSRALSPAAACPGCTDTPLDLLAAVSADGRWIAWVSPRGSLYLADLAAGGDGVRVAEGPVTDVVFGDGELAWISDGYLLVARLDP